MMKPICRAILPLLFVSSIIQAAVPGAGLQTGESLRKWKSDMIAKHDSPAGFDLFYNYTGKPFDEKQQGYLFKFRSYDPELSRWTTFDPSGFPDGANNLRYVERPTTQFDALGLETIDISRTEIEYKYYEPDWSQSVVTWGDFLAGIWNFSLNFMGGTGTALSIGQQLRDIAIGSDPDYTGDPQSNNNFTYIGSDNDVQEWTPFSPVGRTIVEVHELQEFTFVRYNYSYDPENGIFPKVIVETHKITTITVE